MLFRSKLRTSPSSPPPSFHLFLLRVASCAVPARAPLLSDGAAGRSRAGRRAWVAVQSRCKVVFRTGVMPMGGVRLVQASCVQRVAVVMLLFVVLRWSEPEAEVVLVDLYFFLCCHGGGRKDTGGRGSFSRRTIFVRSWGPISAVNPKGCFNNMLRFLLVEGRPIRAPATQAGSSYSSRPSSQKGGSSSELRNGNFQCLPLVFCWWCCSHSSAPSGFVPGGVGIGPGSKQAVPRTRLLFNFVYWGPICKVSDFGCNLYFLLGLVVKCCMLI